MQVKIDGKPTVWCAQHDPLSLAPEHARTKEPPSLSGGESAELVRFLMRKAPITGGTKAMIESAMAWFESHKLTGLRKTQTTEGKTDYAEDAASKEVYWARFYDLKTGKAIFPGSQDGINYPTFRDMAAKNKVAYDFMTAKPGDLITKEVQRWKKRLEKEE
jgi:PelA/Pel-15E family pectate lyase